MGDGRRRRRGLRRRRVGERGDEWQSPDTTSMDEGMKGGGGGERSGEKGEREIVDGRWEKEEKRIET